MTMTAPEERIPFLDEQLFLLELAERVNSFIKLFPHESQHVLSQFIPYEYELKFVHENMKKQTLGGSSLDPSELPEKPGGHMVAILCALMQTQNTENSYFLRPIIAEDPDYPGFSKILGVKVVSQKNAQTNLFSS